MTTKRLGIVLAVVFVLWGMAGIGWFALSPSPQPGGFTVDLAYAGDPDKYEEAAAEGSNSNASETTETEPIPTGENEVSETKAVIQAVLLLVSLFTSGTP